jgi:hypothetical protein
VWARRGVYRIFLWRYKETRPLGRYRRIWEDNIQMNLLEVGRGGVDWIILVQDRGRWWVLLKAIMNLRVPYNAGDVSTS